MNVSSGDAELWFAQHTCCIATTPGAGRVLSDRPRPRATAASAPCLCH